MWQLAGTQPISSLEPHALLLSVVHLLFCTVTRELISALVKFKIASLPPEVSNYPTSRAASTPMSALLMDKYTLLSTQLNLNFLVA
jgi:hypothetical protein